MRYSPNELSAQFNRHQRPPKEKVSPKAMYLPDLPIMPTMQQSKNGEASHSGQLFQPTIDGETWKKGQLFTLLKRITSYKSVNSESIGVSVLSQRVPSWGSCHLVDSTWVTHLNWNNFSNFCCGMHRSWQRPKTKNLTRREFSGRRELATDAQHSCGKYSCPP